jgi:RHS repeat-associated protein
LEYFGYKENMGRDSIFLVNHYTYDPWGMPPANETYDGISNLYRFANYIWDAEPSLYYCINRIYDPVTWRFTTEDPVTGQFDQPMTLHRYLYVTNNPINGKDPTGRFPDWIINTIYGANTLYTSLDAALGKASDDDILSGVINVNNWRENWFDVDNLKNNTTVRQWLTARGEGYLARGMNSLIEAQYQMLSVCNWGGLAKCLGWKLAKTGIKEGIGITSCAICAAGWEIPGVNVVACGTCTVYTAIKGNPVAQVLSSIKKIEDLSTCIYDNCGNNH